MKIYLRNIIFVLIIGIAIFVRIHRLGLPTEPVFDEIYFPTFANNYLTSTDFYDSHPPLGKLIIATSIAGLGNNPIGWRLSNMIFGIGLVIMITSFIYFATQRTLPSVITFLLLIMDPMLLVESRIGLINIFMIFFSICGMWCYWHWLKNPNRLTSYIFALLLFGAAGAVKWIGFGPLVASILFTAFLKLSGRYVIPIKPQHILFLLFLPELVYLTSFLPDLFMRYDLQFSQWWTYMKWWHTSSFHYHAGLDATHPYGSQWWSWPFTLRPLWLYYKSVDSNMVVGIFEPGHPITWIGGIIGLVWTSIKLTKFRRYRSNPLLLYLIIIYLVTYIPWAFIGRVKFIYHYFLPLISLHLISALALEAMYKNRVGRYIASGILVAGSALFILYLPLFIGLPIPTWYYQKLMFIKGWI